MCDRDGKVRSSPSETPSGRVALGAAACGRATQPVPCQHRRTLLSGFFSWSSSIDTSSMRSLFALRAEERTRRRWRWLAEARTRQHQRVKVNALKGLALLDLVQQVELLVEVVLQLQVQRIQPCLALGAERSDKGCEDKLRWAAGGDERREKSGG